MRIRIRTIFVYVVLFVAVFGVAFGIHSFTFNAIDKKAAYDGARNAVIAYFTAIQKKDYKAAASMAEYPAIQRPKNMSAAEMLAQSNATSPLISYHIDSIKVVSPTEALVNITSTSPIMKEKFVKGKPVMYKVNATGSSAIHVYNRSGAWKLYIE